MLVCVTMSIATSFLEDSPQFPDIHCLLQLLNDEQILQAIIETPEEQCKGKQLHYIDVLKHNVEKKHLSDNELLDSFRLDDLDNNQNNTESPPLQTKIENISHASATVDESSKSIVKNDVSIPHFDSQQINHEDNSKIILTRIFLKENAKMISSQKLETISNIFLDKYFNDKVKSGEVQFLDSISKKMQSKNSSSDQILAFASAEKYTIQSQSTSTISNKSNTPTENNSVKELKSDDSEINQSDKSSEKSNYSNPTTELASNIVFFENRSTLTSAAKTDSYYSSLTYFKPKQSVLIDSKTYSTIDTITPILNIELKDKLIELDIDIPLQKSHNKFATPISEQELVKNSQIIQIEKTSSIEITDLDKLRGSLIQTVDKKYVDSAPDHRAHIDYSQSVYNRIADNDQTDNLDIEVDNNTTDNESTNDRKDEAKTMVEVVGDTQDTKGNNTNVEEDSSKAIKPQNKNSQREDTDLKKQKIDQGVQENIVPKDDNTAKSKIDSLIESQNTNLMSYHKETSKDQTDLKSPLAETTETPNKISAERKSTKFNSKKLEIRNINVSVSDSSSDGKTWFVNQNVIPRILTSESEKIPQILVDALKNFDNLPECLKSALRSCRKNPKEELESLSLSLGVPMVYSNLIIRRRCKRGETLINNSCLLNCPDGFLDQGLFCRKPQYIPRPYSTSPSPGFEAITSTLYVGECPLGFEPIGSTICRVGCPLGWKDYGTICRKPARLKNAPIYVNGVEIKL